MVEDYFLRKQDMYKQINVDGNPYLVEKIPAKSGIYFIANWTVDKIYIGSSRRLDRRFGSHVRDLRNNTHPNCHLQNSFNLYGEESFLFTVVTFCEIDQLLDAEQSFISNCPDEFIYNILKNVRKSPEGSKKYNRRKNNASKPKESKKFKVIDPNGVVHELENFSKFCKINKLRVPSLRRVISGVRKTYKGWTRLIDGYSPEESQKILNQKEKYVKKFKLIDPDGICHEGTNYSNFCKLKGLSVSGISSVLSGRLAHYKHWTKFPEDGDIIKKNKQYKNFKLVSPDGIVHEGTNIHKFAKELGLNSSPFYKVMSGVFYSCHGWTKFQEKEQLEV